MRVEQSDDVLTVTLDRPKVNAIDIATSRRLGEVFVEFGDNPALRVAIVTGAGPKVFSAGMDITEYADGETHERMDHGPGGFAGLTELFSLNKPVIAALNGLAVGGGFELALACDLIVAGDHAEVFFPETTLGNLADAGGVQRLPRRLPFHIAMELLLTGRRMGAAEAHQYGLINKVVPGDRVMDTAFELARQVAEGAPLSVQAVKEVVRGCDGLSVENAFQKIHSRTFPIYEAMLASEDHEEGPRAFAEKRPPRFTGR